MRTTLLLAATALAMTGCGHKKEEAPPPVGWYGGEGWTGQCYFPKSYDQLGSGDRRLARADALEALTSQWRGERDDGVSFDSDMVTELETVLLGTPEAIEDVSTTNAAFCQKFMSAEPGTASLSSWRSWMKGLAPKLTEGDCPHPPMRVTAFQYLELDQDWQFKMGVCQGDTVNITASTRYKYRITEDGDYIDVRGAEESATGTDFPCNINGCKVGMLVGRFTSVSGVETVFPVGDDTTFDAPEHGWIEVQVNDPTRYDNTYRMQGNVVDHTSITYKGETH